MCVQKLATIPAGVPQNVTNENCLECFESEKYAFGVTTRPRPGVHWVLWAALGDHPQSSFNPKILLIKVVGYDLLMIKIPVIDLLFGPT